MKIFYDLETSGLDRNSQIFQAAFVSTDNDLNVLSSAKFESRRSPWVVPSAGSMLITGFTPDKLENAQQTAYEMMRGIDGWVRAQGPSTVLGYNSMNFDEGVLSYNQSQNLQDPKLTRANGNGRGDVAEMVKASIVFMPGALTLNTPNNQGNSSLKLGDVAGQNGVKLSKEDAHDAMNDIVATVGVAAVVRKAAPQVWGQMMQLTTAADVDTFLVSNAIFTKTHYSYGKGHGGIYTALSAEEGRPDAQVIFNLAHDPAQYRTMSVDQLSAVMQQDKGKNPFKTMRKDRQPMLMPMDLSGPVISKSYDGALYAARAGELRGDAAFLENVSKASALARLAQADYKPTPEIPEATQKKLDDWAKDFHAAATWKDKAALAEGFTAKFGEEAKANERAGRYGFYAERLVYEHAPDLLSPEKQEGMKRYIASRILNTDPEAPYMTLPKARTELEEIKKERAANDPRWTQVTEAQIKAIEGYYSKIESEYAPHQQALPPPPAPQSPPPSGGQPKP